jgi:hypothetical protein
MVLFWVEAGQRATVVIWTGLGRSALLLSAPESPSYLIRSVSTVAGNAQKDRPGITCTHLDLLPGSRFSKAMRAPDGMAVTGGW